MLIDTELFLQSCQSESNLKENYRAYRRVHEYRTSH
jgi:hypothetical protein